MIYFLVIAAFALWGFYSTPYVLPRLLPLGIKESLTNLLTYKTLLLNLASDLIAWFHPSEGGILLNEDTSEPKVLSAGELHSSWRQSQTDVFTPTYDSVCPLDQSVNNCLIAMLIVLLTASIIYYYFKRNSTLQHLHHGMKDASVGNMTDAASHESPEPCMIVAMYNPPSQLTFKSEIVGRFDLYEPDLQMNVLTLGRQLIPPIMVCEEPKPCMTVAIYHTAPQHVRILRVVTDVDHCEDKSVTSIGTLHQVRKKGRLVAKKYNIQLKPKELRYLSKPFMAAIEEKYPSTTLSYSVQRNHTYLLGSESDVLKIYSEIQSEVGYHQREDIAVWNEISRLYDEEEKVLNEPTTEQTLGGLVGFDINGGNDFIYAFKDYRMEIVLLRCERDLRAVRRGFNLKIEVISDHGLVKMRGDHVQVCNAYKLFKQQVAHCQGSVNSPM